MPGTEEVTALVKELEAEYATASWNTRNMFAHAPKPSVTRVKHTYYEKAASKLPQEVHPEDIVEVPAKEWSEMADEDYDGNYIASTDPVHPVSTDYSHPSDDDDGNWILQHLLPEDIETSEPSEGVDFHKSDWDWGNNDRETAAESWRIEQLQSSKDTRTIQDTIHTNTSLVAWGPDANKTSSSEISMSDSHDSDAARKAKVEEVIKTFWSVVNNNKLHIEHLTPDPSLSQNANPPTNLFHDLNIPNTSPFPSPPLWTDGPSDSPPRASTPPSPNSTRAWYDKQRKILRQRRETDVEKFCSDWLYISRCEIRDFEGVEGRMVCEPVGLGRR